MAALEADVGTGGAGGAGGQGFGHVVGVDGGFRCSVVGSCSELVGLAFAPTADGVPEAGTTVGVLSKATSSRQIRKRSKTEIKRMYKVNFSSERILKCKGA